MSVSTWLDTPPSDKVNQSSSIQQRAKIRQARLAQLVRASDFYAQADDYLKVAGSSPAVGCFFRLEFHVHIYFAPSLAPPGIEKSALNTSTISNASASFLIDHRHENASPSTQHYTLHNHQWHHIPIMERQSARPPSGDNALKPV
ncbi:hypothetical protein AGABI2DRAFT_114477 [Agaricus bisporus var. bisporus H97]|uniref:hypothetical protein n=1 Tax=Agaricus bisporus var. bisporus (strain H97 / ATCC MYA-4626 / FGSC 10389) TaxID=936046 RepID=UPI00029F6C13|nr:hypothetical protein AGABI2DRAFT_114477 [Agaricus bisporus var. bisporus H97]EKV51757.1 hypothetical protein AGABI2DRAFT_114477 [Agaricus bisporus var. bisporus H97]